VRQFQIENLKFQMKVNDRTSHFTPFEAQDKQAVALRAVIFLRAFSFWIGLPAAKADL
jgi:hypothetical protein